MMGSKRTRCCYHHGLSPRPPLYLWLLGVLLLLSVGTTICLLFLNSKITTLETLTARRDISLLQHRRELKTTTLNSFPTLHNTNPSLNNLHQKSHNSTHQKQQQPNQRRPLKCRRVQTWDEFDKCSQGRFLSCQPPPSRWDSWETVQRCLHGRTVPPRHLNHTQIYLIGERHSGTKFVLEQLHQCFADHVPGVILVKRDFIRHKHFFQRPTLQSLQDKIVISVVRNPYDWVAAMRRKPYHMPNHQQGFALTTEQQQHQEQPIKADIALSMNKSGDDSAAAVERRRTATATPLPQPIPLDWHDFVTRPWTTNRSQIDLDMIRNKNTTMATCAMGFAFDEVVPCQMDPGSSTFGVVGTEKFDLMRGHEPVYELRRDKSGRPFDNILQLRADKIRNLVLEVGSLQLGGFLTVRYEDLLQHGTEQLLRQVGRILLDPKDKNGEEKLQSMIRACHVQRPQPKRLFARTIPSDFRQYLHDHIDWEMEKVVGYFPTDPYGLSEATNAT